MPSPFPGMNPYLENESVWRDFHQTFILTALAMLTRQISPEYCVRIEQWELVHDLTECEAFSSFPSHAHIAGASSPSSPSSIAIAEPPAYGRLLLTSVVKERHGYLTIRGEGGLELVTVIVLLSPSIKVHGRHRAVYLWNRMDFVGRGLNLVEIDFLRGGPQLPLTGLPPCDYYAMVGRAGERPRVGIWPIGLREKLPNVPIPLRPGDPDATLDLRHVLDRVYDAAGYEDYIYDGSPQPPLSNSDAAWASEALAAAGR